MIRFSKIFLYLTVAVLLVWQLPWCYAFFTAKPVKTPFTMYSSVLGDFIFIQTDANKQIRRSDTKGNTYTQQQVDSLLPSFYVRQLTADERFPDTICGKAVSPKDIQMTNFTFKSVPSAINAPQTGIYFLMESMSKRVELKMPDDAFRFTGKGIEFICMETNRIDEPKSKLFTDMLLQKGFVFPASYASGNPTTRKDYDEGYLVLDANHQLFHLKCTKGCPYVKAIRLPDNVRPEYVFITEFRSRQTLGYMVDSRLHFYVIQSDGSVIKSAIPAFDPTKDELTIFGNMFDWTVKRSTDKDDYYYALDATDYSLIKEYAYKDIRRSVPGLSFTSPDDKFVKPRF